MSDHGATAKTVAGGLQVADADSGHMMAPSLAAGLVALAMTAVILVRDLRRTEPGGRGTPSPEAGTLRELDRAKARIAHLTRHDELTDLPNRRGFVEALARAIDRAMRGGGGLAVLVLGLDDFKDLDFILGRPAGEKLLRAAGHRIAGTVRRTDIVAHLGGDEFAVMVGGERPGPPPPPGERRRPMAGEGSGVAIATAAACVAKSLLGVLGEPLVVDGGEVVTRATVGVAAWSADIASAETLLARADLALREARADRRGTCRVFTEAMDVRARERVTMMLDLREAIAAGQLMLLYQPQVDIGTGRIVGLEALARWRHPTRGLLGAGEFIPAAEATGLIAPLGQWVVREACRQVRHWLDAGFEPMPVAVNLSAAQFKQTHELGDDIGASLAEFGVPPRLLELELTESVLMEISPEHDAQIARLRDKGHRLAIDDFGSGYSSLDHLLRYPADRIKIDRSFVADIGASRGADAIVRLVLEFGRALDIEVVAEGVETEAQLRLLEARGARIAQGHYVAMPHAPADMTGWLTTGRVDPRSAA
jgi:predicted signal transduction protein with EAL and GGDEF domain